MPFRSKAQARFMFAKHPKIAKEFASKTPSISALPNKVKSSPMAVRIVEPKPKYSSKGVRTKLNVGANKMFFRGNGK